MSFAKMGKTLPIFSVDKGIARVVSDVLRKVHQEDASSIKCIARIAGVNLHTARKWYEGKVAPNAANLLLLMAYYPHLQFEIEGMIELSRGALEAKPYSAEARDSLARDKFVQFYVLLDAEKLGKLNIRQLWVLSEEHQGRQCSACDIVQQWGVSQKTAFRDLSQLKAVPC